MRTAIPFSTALLAALLISGPAGAQSAVTEQQDSVRQLVIYGSDPCPQGIGEEIVVCARRPETERYRIPEQLRDEAQTPSPESESWAARSESLEYVGETGIQSCSTVGPGGQTGCWEQLMRQAREERRAGQRARARQP